SPPDNLRESKAFVGPHAMAVQPNNPNRIFIVSARSILYSTNGGTHWAKSPFKVRGRANPPAPTSIFVDEAGTLYVGTQDGGAYTCSDSTHFCSGGAGGSAWTAWGLNSGAPRMITAIAESNAPPAPRTFWMATSSGLYRRLPGANEWAQVRATPGYVYSDVAVDPTCHTRVYTALGYLDPILRSRGGIEFSSDNGARWTTITTGVALHNVPIPQVLVAPESPGRLLAATYGRGVWEYDS